MSLDRSLKSANALLRHRNVLTRAERLDRLVAEEKWDEQKGVYGLPKVAHRKAAISKSSKKEKEAEAAEGAVAGTAPPAKAAAAPAAKGAKGAKGK